MKKRSINLIFTLLITIPILLTGEDKKPDARKILQQSIDISTPKTMIASSKQIAHFYTGKKETFKIKNYSAGGNEKMLFVYEYPNRIRGNKFLFLKGGDIWAYFAKTGRKRRIASSARKSKMQGSDFSYEDISMMST